MLAQMAGNIFIMIILGSFFPHIKTALTNNNNDDKFKETAVCAH